MIKIGTRASIPIDGRLLLTIHWDGYPSCLGLKLFNCLLKRRLKKTDGENDKDSILKAAKEGKQRWCRIFHTPQIQSKKHLVD